MQRPSLVSMALFVFLLAGAARSENPPVPDDVGRAVAELKEAFELADDVVIVEAIDRAEGVADPSVVALLAKGLSLRSTAVKARAIDALGRTRHPAALDALHDLFRRDPRLGENEDLYSRLFRAIARHGDPASIPILTHKPFRYLTWNVGRARVLGLGRIRHRDAVQALVEGSRLAGGRGLTGAASGLRGAFREDFRTALTTLTGTDQGIAMPDWEKWWREHGDRLEVTPHRPRVPEDVREHWEAYWQEPYYAPGDAPAPPDLTPPFALVDDPSREQVEEAVAALKEAFRSEDDDLLSYALETHAGVLDKRVVTEIARGLRARSRAVRMMAVDALGWMKYEPALKQLHRMFRRETDLARDDEEMFELLLKAIGRHGSSKSAEVLVDRPFRGLTLASGRARILGLARIRNIEALEELIKASQLAGSTPPRSWRSSAEPRFAKEFRLALWILTGRDLGEDAGKWATWWRDHRRTFRVSPRRPNLPSELRRLWESYWNEPYEEGAPERPREGPLGVRPPAPPAPPAPSAPGFLSDYGKLEVDPAHPERRRWVKGDVDLRAYDHLLFDPIQVIPRPGAPAPAGEGARRAAETLLRILTETIDPYYSIVDAKGPGVLRVRLALTDLRPDAGGGDALRGAGLEAEVLDAATGEVLAMATDRVEAVGEGEVLDVEGAFRTWARRLLDWIDQGRGE
jgi:HEAT repeat protein